MGLPNREGGDIIKLMRRFTCYLRCSFKMKRMTLHCIGGWGDMNQSRAIFFGYVAVPSKCLGSKHSWIEHETFWMCQSPLYNYHTHSLVKWLLGGNSNMSWSKHLVKSWSHLALSIFLDCPLKIFGLQAFLNRTFLVCQKRLNNTGCFFLTKSSKYKKVTLG